MKAALIIALFVLFMCQTVISAHVLLNQDISAYPFENNVDPDQLACRPADQDLQCFLCSLVIHCNKWKCATNSARTKI